MQTSSNQEKNLVYMTDVANIFFKVPAKVLRGIIVVSQSFHRHTTGQHRRYMLLALLLCFVFLSSSAQVTIRFHLTANGKSLVLNDSTYTNAFNETYQVSRLKYYINNLTLEGYDAVVYYDKVSLMDADGADSIALPPLEGIFATVEFTVGVDSALNCSGAQDGALDPLNGMFWTWNSGYIFFKLEGYSPASTADLKRIEHHVGGYRYPNKASRTIKLNLPQPLIIKKGSGPHTVHIKVDLDKYWKGINEIKIADQALLMTPGGLAIKAADNFQTMFSITAVE